MLISFAMIRFFSLLFLGHVLFSSEIQWNGKVYNDQTVSELITIITTTNPVPSIPYFLHLYNSQVSLFRIPALALCKKIIVFDGLQKGFESRAEDYEMYKQGILDLTESDPYFQNTELIFCDRWVHLAGAIREAMERVTTPYVFIHQHDFVLVKDFDLNGVIATMEANENIKYVRFALPLFNYHWLNWDPPILDTCVLGTTFVPLLRHFEWSDNDHVATSDYYRNFVLPQCSHGAMEWYLQPALYYSRQEAGDLCHSDFGTYLYGGIYDGGYFYHSDGRQNWQPPNE